MAEALILYDGVCGLCNKSVQFILPRDRAGVFAFCPLQSRQARAILERHHEPLDFNSFIVVVNEGQPDERLLHRYRAALFVLRRLGRGYALVWPFAWCIPRPVGDWLYRQVAARRYAWFGKADACLLPKPGEQERFVGFDQLDDAA